jgi:hypothetical protein
MVTRLFDPGFEKSHRWVGAYVVPLSDRAAKRAAHVLRYGHSNERLTARTLPVLIDIYCEQCRRSYGQADKVCRGLTIRGDSA